MALPDSNYANLAAAAIPNPGSTTDTTITISATNGATFPNTPFFATIMPTDGVANSTNSEIVEVTAASTSGANTTFTVTRAQRNTSAISWNANEAVIAHAVYTEDVTPLQDAAFINDTIGTQTNDAYVGTNNIQDGAVTTPKIADGAVTPAKISTSTYSTSEQVVGTWTDGKPIYRKVVTGFSMTPVVGANSGSIDLSSLSIDNFIKLNIRLKKGSTYQFPSDFYTNSNNYLFVFYQNNNSTLQIRYGADSTTAITGEFIIEYTKTTD